MKGSMPEVLYAVDWSGAQRNRVAVAKKKLGESGVDIRVMTREAAVRRIIEAAETHTVLAGFDFAFSLPDFFLSANGLRSAMDLWARVDQDAEHWIRHGFKPFWGVGPYLRKWRDIRHEFRATEVAARAARSVFQLIGAGAVGKGSLRGMPYLLELRARFAVWPFDPPRWPMAVEIFPRIFMGDVRKEDPQARLLYLQRQKLDRFEGWQEATRDSDRFDAFVSVLSMEDNLRRAEEPFPYPPGGLAGREGWIWGVTRNEAFDAPGCETCLTVPAISGLTRVPVLAALVLSLLVLGGAF